MYQSTPRNHADSEYVVSVGVNFTIDIQGACSLHAACMPVAYAGLSGVDDRLSGVVARMHPAASCQSKVCIIKCSS